MIAAGLALRGADRALLNQLAAAGFAWEPATALATVTGAATAAAMAWLGATLASLVPAATVWAGCGAAALVFARFLSPPRRRELREPTRSIFAFALVLAIVQMFDAVRLAALGLAAMTGEPLLVACGIFLGAPIGLAQPAKVSGRSSRTPQ